jgi:hypothetical protein
MCAGNELLVRTVSGVEGTHCTSAHGTGAVYCYSSIHSQVLRHDFDAPTAPPTARPAVSAAVPTATSKSPRRRYIIGYKSIAPLGSKVTPLRPSSTVPSTPTTHGV